MICPKCGKGHLIKVIFNSSGKRAFVCNECNSLWFKGEIIDLSTGHDLESFTKWEIPEQIIEEKADLKEHL